MGAPQTIDWHPELAGPNSLQFAALVILLGGLVNAPAQLVPYLLQFFAAILARAGSIV